MQAKRLLALRIDPSQAKKEEKIKQQINSENSFEKVADEWHPNQKLSWTPRHAEYVARRLKANILPNLGSRSINEITAPELLSTLRIIEAREAYDVAHRMLQTCGQIFRYAIATGRAERDITADLRGALKTRKTENYARLDAKELPEFMQDLEEYVGELQTKLALRFLILTFVRTGELRGAKWSEIDFVKNEWRIPAERMKMRDPHHLQTSRNNILLLPIKFLAKLNI